MAAASQIRADLHLLTTVIDTEADLRGLVAEWKDLFQRAGCNNVFLTFEWLSQWWAHFGERFRLFLVTVRESDGRLLGLAPLYISEFCCPLRLRRIGLLGDRFVGSDHLDILVERNYEPPVAQSLRDFMLDQRNEWDFIELTSASQNSVALTYLQRAMGDAEIAAHKSDSSLCPYFELPATTEQYWTGLRPKLRKNVRYQTRSLQREASVKFVVVEDTLEMERSLEDLVRLHELRSEQRGHYSTFSDPRVASFHRDALSALAAQREARIFFLELAGKRIAALYGFSCGRKFFYYQSGADPAYSRFGVGTLLLSSVVEWAIHNHHTEFDFLRGDESYKRLWATGARQLQDVSFFSRGSKGRIAQAIRIARHSLHEWKKALLPRATTSDRRTEIISGV